MFDHPLTLPSAYAGEFVKALSPTGTLARIGAELRAKRLPVDNVALGNLLDIIFFASFAREEGHFARFSVAVTLADGGFAYKFESREPLSVESLRKLSAACAEGATCLHVCAEQHQWFVWGVGVNEKPPERWVTARSAETFLVITAADPGVLRIQWEDEVIFSFSGGRSSIPSTAQWVRTQIQSALPTQSDAALALRHLESMHAAMHAHGRGGALLVIAQHMPEGITFRYPLARPVPAPYRDMIRHIAPLPMAALFEEKARVELPDIDDPKNELSAQRILMYKMERTDREAALIGHLTAIDGVVVIDHSMVMRGFGGKIAIPDDSNSIAIFDVDSSSQLRTTTTVGEAFSGMRHKSAAVACFRHGPGALALVQSQDGTLSVVIVSSDNELSVIRPLGRFPGNWVEEAARHR
jgi:hypothetical protein